MNSIMSALGLVFRTPFALVGLFLATLYGIGYAVILILLGIAWIIVLPLSFIGASMGSKHGIPPFERFKQGKSSQIDNWKDSIGGSFGFHADLFRWWTTGSLNRR